MTEIDALKEQVASLGKFMRNEITYLTARIDMLESMLHTPPAPICHESLSVDGTPTPDDIKWMEETQCTS
jgi:hypothetical protein